MKKTLQVLAAFLLLTGQVHAHPLDFLTVEQRVLMMNTFLEAQDNLRTRPGKPGAADGSGAAPLTVEQRMKLLEWFMTGQTGGTPQPANAPAIPAQAPAAMQATTASALVITPAVAQAAAPNLNTEADLAAAFDKWRNLDSGVKFERFRDGFAINGARYIDPEGTIVAYGFDAQSGDFTYLAQYNNGQYILKSGRASSTGEPIEIAKAEKRGSQWTVTTTTGKKFSGSRLIPLSRGFIVARENTGFRYVPGKGSTSIAAPEQFAIAALQNGDVSSTGYILLERIVESGGSGGGSIGGLISSVQSLGSTFGIGKKEDYALLNIDTGKSVAINISTDDKRVQIMSACRQRNFMFAECERMDSYESLFQANGARNMTHYFWRINWFNAGGRPILVSQEGGLSQVTATDLGSGKKLTLFERTLGIAAFSATQGTDGKISVSAKLGFNTESKDDIVALLDSAPMAALKEGADKQ